MQPLLTTKGNQRTCAAGVHTLPTGRGVRLVQYGTVLSEVLRKPGPTHSVADVIAAAIRSLAQGPQVALLGFAGGGLIAPLRAMGGDCEIETVDLDDSGYRIFRQLCRLWCGPVRFERAEAAEWLRRQRADYDVIVEDLSIPRGEDVFKPDETWSSLPRLIRSRLKPQGIAVFNLLPPTDGSWGQGVGRILKHFPSAITVHFAEYENRLLLAGCSIAPARMVSRLLRKSLRGIQSRLATRISVRSVHTS